MSKNINNSVESNIKISSIIIAKNEESNIQRCIQSQLECIDDIAVYIDKSSSDKTLEFVKEFPGVRYEIIEWLGFSKTKQYALSKCKFEWVLWIDADEAVRDELKNELILFKKSTPRFTAYKIARRAYFLNKWIKHSGWYPDYVTRLFNKSGAVFSESRVHEHLIIDGSVGKMKGDLDHFTDPNIHHYYKKFNRYTSLAAEELNIKKRRVRITDILFRPVFIFLKMYIFKRGFLDGLEGFLLAAFSANYVLTKYSKLWELSKNKSRDKNS